MAATWTIHNLEFFKNYKGKSDVVFMAHYECFDKDADGNGGSLIGTVSIPADDLSNFISYEDITETQAISWAKDALGADKVSEVESLVAGQIAKKATPTEGSGVPWND